MTSKEAAAEKRRKMVEEDERVAKSIAKRRRLAQKLEDERKVSMNSKVSLEQKQR